MNLSDIVVSAGIQPLKAEGDAAVAAMEMDSRKSREGTLFVCYPPSQGEEISSAAAQHYKVDLPRDSQFYLPAAASNGSRSAIVWSPAGYDIARSLGMAAILLPSERSRFSDQIWRICSAFHHRPTSGLKVVGVTGTNGKTTVAWLVRELLQALCLPCAYLGTLGFELPASSRELPNTTPYAVDLYNMLAEARESGVGALAMEVSSHALKEHRADGLEFDATVLTNLTQDHLDYHGTMDDYENAKWRLFSDFAGSKTPVPILNWDDAVGKKWYRRLGHGMRFSRKKPVEVFASSAQVTVDTIELQVQAAGELRLVRSKLGGQYNVENLLAAVSACLALGYPLAEIAAAAEHARPVPGRFEPVPNSQGIGILVDYAHTPDAVTKLLQAVRPLTNGRIITVFGCGGDRDPDKRPKMARAASEASDLTILTSDNPRTEDPEKILQDVKAGIVPGADSIAIVDRPKAVERAILEARPGDVVVIAGKGHEDYQIIGRDKYPMDDRELARQALEMKRN